jgi:hypothetical protein
MKKVRLKSQEQIKRLLQNGEIQHIFTSDSGEISHYGTAGNPTNVQSIWWEEYGQEFAVVDHPNPISKENYEARKIFFDENVPPKEQWLHDNKEAFASIERGLADSADGRTVSIGETLERGFVEDKDELDGLRGRGDGSEEKQNKRLARGPRGILMFDIKGAPFLRVYDSPSAGAFRDFAIPTDDMEVEILDDATFLCRRGTVGHEGAK